ncbi:hypothetical protein LOTGIDRAFT_124009 [Lottia gigantea]|uniref:Uncharacterized protein n=1 Tax=Lottia gigantea TaxID=225164 RepID=V4A0G6_LOTGI|nr:hypothetical protein LOTGIDRAFT_124009 [Lottia gigantea]ESO90157.1 hypothetical protein LOTGIDRAFT_124009 [Lottia gigantea]
MLIYFGVSVVELRGVITKSLHQSKHHNHGNFSYFTFTQAWPATVCIQGADLGHTCNKVLNETAWTVHGLWPSCKGASEDQPANCNKSAKFHHDAISPLINDLKMYWPNLFKDTSPDDFWKHEWMKHGTCALNVSKTANEYLYFLQGLTLYKQISLTHILDQLNYHPDDNKTLDVRKLLNDLKTKLNGITPIIGCYRSKKHEFYLDQIEVCYSKQFQMFDCLKLRPRTLFFKSFKEDIGNDLHLEDCPKNGLVYYPTIPK